MRKVVILSLILILLLILDILVTNKTFTQNLVDNLKEQVLVSEKSSARIYMVDNKVNISFKITSSDSKRAQKFSQNLGTSVDWTKGISLELDQNSLSKISNLLPLSSEIAFDKSGKRVIFKSNSKDLIKPIQLSDNQTFSTGSASLNFSQASSSDFKLEVVDPAPLVIYASSSGKLNLSSKLQSLFASLAKVAKIRVKVSGKSVDGEITLK